MRLPILVVIGMLLSVTAVRGEQAVDVEALEVRATQALTRGDYERALPILEQLLEQVEDQPRRERLEEQLRLTRRNLERAEQEAQEPAEPDAQGRLIDRLLPQEERVPQTAEQRKAHAPPVEGEVRELTIKQLGNFEYDSDFGGNVPEDVQRLNGTTVRINGFMIPLEQATRIRRFVLVADLFACCFGQPPQLHHSIEVTAPAGKSVDYFPDEIVVEGTLNVEEKTEDGWIMGLFELEATSVRPAAK